MTSSQLPPEGFRWVEPTGDTSARPPRRRRWWMVAALVMVLALTAGVVAAVWWRPWEAEHGTDTARAVEPLIGTPTDLLVSFPLNRQPVPGWHVSAAEIGLPPHVNVGNLFASSGDKAYFVTSHCDDPCRNPMGWVYGLDAHSGARLFPPVPMTGFYGNNSDCYNNGPSVAVCVTEGYAAERPQLVWVIDLDHGAVGFTGPTDLYPEQHVGPQPTIRAVGNHFGEARIVAAVKEKGVYGIGSHAELTWFVPGRGELSMPSYLRVADIPPLTIAMQTRSRSDQSGPKARVFSVVDGKELTPKSVAGITVGNAAVYNGGFAYQYQEGAAQGLLFYDTQGRQIEKKQIGYAYPLDNPAMLIVTVDPTTQPQWVVYNAAGNLLARIPGKQIATEFQTIGTKLYVKRGQTGADESWQQWDLVTGTSGSVCNLNLGVDYVASDGKVIISRGTGGQDLAIDASTCQTRWSTPPEPPESRVVIWKVGTGLIQRTYVSDSIMSLRPPA